MRVVHADDWRLWRGARLQALRDAPEAFSATLADWEAADERRWRRRLDDVPFNVVVRKGEEVVGQASGTAVDADRAVELISMWVARGGARHRRRGHAHRRSERMGTIEGRSRGPPGGTALERTRLRLYERTGFVRVGDAEDPSEVAMMRVLRPD